MKGQGDMKSGEEESSRRQKCSILSYLAYDLSHQL